MSESDAKITIGSDALGLGKPLHAVAKRVMDILAHICSPAAEELGLLLKDQVHHWRLRNLDSILNVSQERLNDRVADGQAVTAHPRLAYTVVEVGSWVDDEEVQRWWGGLLAASCTEDGRDESNLMFMHLLRDLTTSQARIVKHVCETASKYVFGPHRLIVVPTHESVSLSVEEAFRIAGISDVQQLDRELDHLRALNLIDGGLDAFYSDADLRPTPLCLHLYVRCQGSRQSPADYFGLESNGAREARPSAAGALADFPELDESMEEIMRERKRGRQVEARD